MTADDVNIDFEKFYDDAAGFPDEGIYTPPTAYEQSKAPIRSRAGRSMTGCARLSARQGTASALRATGRRNA